MDKKYDKTDKTGNKNPFKVPEGYFEGLTDQIMKQVSEVEVEQPRLPGTWDKLKPWIYMAAMFAGIALMFKVFRGDFKQGDSLVSNNKSNQIQQAEISSEDSMDEMVYDYLEYEATQANYRDAFYLAE